MAQAVLQGLHELEGSTSDGKIEAGALKINREVSKEQPDSDCFSEN